MERKMRDMAAQAGPPHTNPRDAVADVIRQLRDTLRVPVSFIQSDEQVETNWTTTGQEAATTLITSVTQTGLYRWRMIMGRSVLYPVDPVWDHKIMGIAITGVPRLDGAMQYTTAVRSRIPALDDLGGPPMKGDPRSPVYEAPVSLSPEASLIEHLVELLGTNKHLVFTIERGPSGRRVLHFQEVSPKPPSGSW
jgi:hypothetical protein